QAAPSLLARIAGIVHQNAIPAPRGSTHMIRSFAALSLLLVSTTALAAPARPARDAAAWDVNAPPGATLRQVPLNVSEGTWMNVDVSPDGRTIAFDLLGDIYTMGIAGGRPTR